MRAEGYLLREIAEALGVGKQTVHSWLVDPDGAKMRARKDTYRGTCESCGKATHGSNGAAHAPRLCGECREWPEEAIIAAMQDWAESHGGRPPTCTDWQKAGPDHPTDNVASTRGGWNALLLKAGFELVTDRRPETQEQMEQMLREGLSTAKVAEHFGWCAQNVHARMHNRGRKVSELREAA